MENISPNHDDVHNFSKRHLVDIISNRDLRLYEIINLYVIASSISVFGVVTNIINMIVFYKQGFATTMNISFFGLAISDLCSLVVILWFTVVLSDLLVMAGVRMSSVEVAYIAGGHPHICFARITSWITVFITTERCLCITFPLKIKQLITPRRTTVILCAIFILIILSFEPEFQTAYIDWRFEIKLNKTLLGLMFTRNRKDLEGVTFILYAISGCVSFITVIIFTLILVIQLNKTFTWRNSTNIKSARSKLISMKEIKTMRMVVVIATVLIVCYTPGVAVSSVSFFEHEFAIMGQYRNGFVAMWCFVFVFEAFNSSINIVLYYKMSSKYRDTFRLMFDMKDSVTA